MICALRLPPAARVAPRIAACCRPARCSARGGRAAGGVAERLVVGLAPAEQLLPRRRVDAAGRDRPRLAWNCTTDARVPAPKTPSTTRFAPYLLSCVCAAFTALVSAEPCATGTTSRGHVPLPAMPSTRRDALRRLERLQVRSGAAAEDAVGGRGVAARGQQVLERHRVVVAGLPGLGDRPGAGGLGGARPRGPWSGDEQGDQRPARGVRQARARADMVERCMWSSREKCRSIPRGPARAHDPASGHRERSRRRGRVRSR